MDYQIYHIIINPKKSSLLTVIFKKRNGGNWEVRGIRMVLGDI